MSPSQRCSHKLLLLLLLLLLLQWLGESRMVEFVFVMVCL
jgi:hypothetical protein